MNINYEDIITKANARKEALKAFEAMLEDTDQYAGHLIDALKYFKALKDSVSTIDDEGQRMALPIIQRVMAVGSVCESALTRLTEGNTSDGSNTYVVAALARAVSK